MKTCSYRIWLSFVAICLCSCVGCKTSARNVRIAEPVSAKEQAAAENLLAWAGNDADKAKLLTKEPGGHVIQVDLTVARGKKDADLASIADLPYLQRAKIGLPDVTDAGM